MFLAVEWLQQGKSVPGPLALIGFDNSTAVAEIWSGRVWQSWGWFQCGFTPGLTKPAHLWPGAELSLQGSAFQHSSFPSPDKMCGFIVSSQPG